VGAELFFADGQTDGQMIAFHNFESTPKSDQWKRLWSSWEC